MIEKDLDKVLNYMKQYVENKYEHDSEPMLNWKDLKLVLDEIERLNNKYNKALELLTNCLPCEVDDFMNVHSDYCETHCGVDEEQYKECWDKFIEWKLGSDKE